MSYKLPSLNALRAFEAASRLTSFTRAADELCVTQGAISRHIHILEESLGVKLFFRVTRGIELTPAGTCYLQTIQDAFQRIDSATREIRGDVEGRAVCISAVPTLTSRWLVPRISRLKRLYPDLALRIETTEQNVDFALGGVDLAIETQAREGVAIRSLKIFDIDLVPVCSPRQVDGRPPPTNFDELRECTLLHTLTPNGMWEYWFDRAGFLASSKTKALAFQTSDLAYQAAIDGLGIALAVPRLVGRELMAGTLVIPINVRVSCSGGYFLNALKSRLHKPSVMNVFNWLVTESVNDEPESRCIALAGKSRSSASFGNHALN